MYIHIGNRYIIPVSETIGIFNGETIKNSDENIYLNSQISDSVKTIVVNEKNEIFTSSVSPFTVIKRTDILKDSLWRLGND